MWLSSVADSFQSVPLSKKKKYFLQDALGIKEHSTYGKWQLSDAYTVNIYTQFYAIFEDKSMQLYCMMYFYLLKKQ